MYVSFHCWNNKTITCYYTYKLIHLAFSDALLEDLQTSVSRSATPSRGGRTLSPQVEYRVAANPTRVISESR